MDNTQTGSSLRKVALKKLETIIHSSAGPYVDVNFTIDKLEKGKMIFIQLFVQFQLKSTLM